MLTAAVRGIVRESQNSAESVKSTSGEATAERAIEDLHGLLLLLACGKAKRYDEKESV